MGIRISAAPLLAAFVALPTFAQETAVHPEFAVASVKVSQSRARANVDSSPVTLTADGSLSYLLAWAYDLKERQLSGPGWLRTERYRITAKAAKPTPVPQIKLMLQSLLQSPSSCSFTGKAKIRSNIDVPACRPFRRKLPGSCGRFDGVEGAL